MKSKVYLLALFITLSGTSICAQEGNNNRVTVEDQGGNSEYKENDDKFRELDKQFDDLMDSFRKTYRNLYNSGFGKVNGNFSKEKLGVFISEAGIYKNNINNNAQVSNLNNQLNDLAKVTSRSSRDYVAYFKNSLLPSVDGDIASAKSLINEIELNESKKEVSVGFGNTNNTSTNTNNSTVNTNNQQQSSNSRNYQNSQAGLYYQNALERQSQYEQGMQAATNQLVDVGLSIANDIQQTRIANINYRKRDLSESLNEMIPLDKECADLYANNDYQAFLIKEKELRKHEGIAISNINSLIEKGVGSNLRALKKEISTNQKKRLKKILEHNTVQFLKNSKKLTNSELLNEFKKTYINEIRNLVPYLSDEYGRYYYPEGGKYQAYHNWVAFIDEERAIRTREILELNKTENFLSPDYEACFYISNNYYNSTYDQKVFDLFLKSDMSNKEAFLSYALHTKNMIWLDKKDDRQLRLLLGDGSEQVYYYNMDVATKKGVKSIPIYDYLNDRDYGFKESKANELVKGWVKRDEKIYGKKAKKIFEDHLIETTSVESEEQSINSTRMSIKSLTEKKDYNKALSLINKARKEFPNNYGLLMSEARIYQKLGNNAKFLELLKEGIKLNPTNPVLYYNIGVLEAQSGNIEEAINNSKKAIALKPDYADAYINISSLILNKEQLLIEEMNNLGMSTKDNLRYDELNGQRLELYKEVIPYLEKVIQLDDTNEDVKSTLLAIKKQID